MDEDWNINNVLIHISNPVLKEEYCIDKAGDKRGDNIEQTSKFKYLGPEKQIWRDNLRYH